MLFSLASLWVDSYANGKIPRVVPDSQALSSSVWCVTFRIILMKMAFMMAAFCELSKGSYNKIAAWKSDSHFNFELCNSIAGPARNQSKIFFPL